MVGRYAMSLLSTGALTLASATTIAGWGNTLVHSSRIKATMLYVIHSFLTARNVVTADLDKYDCYRLQLPNGRWPMYV